MTLGCFRASGFSGSASKRLLDLWVLMADFAVFGYFRPFGVNIRSNIVFWAIIDLGHRLKCHI